MKLAVRVKKNLALSLAIVTAMGMQVSTMASDYDNHWAKSTIKEWIDYGVVKGYEDGSFKPNSPITRSELAVIIAEIFGLQASTKNTNYMDVKDGAWYQEAINKVTEAGIMQGSDNQFNPSAAITRQEVAVALTNAYKVTISTAAESFKDDEKIASWAKQAVNSLATQGYINGREDGRFDPQANITRAEMVSILDRLTGTLYNQAGSYTGDKKGNVFINTQGVTLEDMIIYGNLFITEGVGTGGVTLKNVTVKGQTVIVGGKEVTSETIKDITSPTKPSTDEDGGNTGVTPEIAKKITGIEVAFSNAASQSYATTDGNIIFNLPQLIEDSAGTNRVSSITVKGDAGKLTTSHTDLALDVNKVYGIQDIISLFKNDLIQAKELLKLAKPEKADAIEELYRDAEERLSNNKDVSIQAIVDEYKLLVEKAQNNGFKLPNQYTKSGTYTASNGKTTTLNLTIQFN